MLMSEVDYLKCSLDLSEHQIKQLIKERNKLIEMNKNLAFEKMEADKKIEDLKVQVRCLKDMLERYEPNEKMN